MRRTAVQVRIRTMLVAATLAAAGLLGQAQATNPGAATAGPGPGPGVRAGVGGADEAFAIPYDRLAARIVASLQVAPGERVLLRFDPETLARLEPVLRKALEAKKATVETLNYGAAPDLEARLARTDVYIWLPAGPRAATDEAQREILARWLDAGKGRQIHFHWSGGTVEPDGLAGEHSVAFDRIYTRALEIDHGRLSSSQERAIVRLCAGEVHVSSPAGTDLRFRVGDRPFNTQDGDGSKARMTRARVRVDREIELPAGVIRVAPIEDSVNGAIVIPSARFDGTRATGIRLELVNGKVVKAQAKTEDAALQAFLKSAPGATQFREFGLGFNPALVPPADSPYLPYYGYGAGIVRLSLGDSTEIGGAVRGGGVRWFFFPDTTVTVVADAGKEEPIVTSGRLAPGVK